MERVCFRLRVKKDRMNEYIARHESVWPDMLAALIETGWQNYSLFLDKSDGTLIGYFETPNLELARTGMAKTEINAKWQTEMAPFFEETGGLAPDEGFKRLLEIFHIN